MTLEDAVERLHSAIDTRLGHALAHYEEVIGDSIPDKAPMPLQVHRRAGEDRQPPERVVVERAEEAHLSSRESRRSLRTLPPVWSCGQ